MDENTAQKSGGDSNPRDTFGPCLLSLDGGGVRGLSTLYILKSIMDRLNHSRRQKQLAPVKPCDVFDLIGGTSTGGYESFFPALEVFVMTINTDLLPLCSVDSR